jgi:hypothetical protein
MTNAIGIHVEANSEGYSRDRAIQCARNYGATVATVVNDALLCQMFLDIGVTPIHRINRHGLLDDNQDQYGTTRLYIQTAAIEVPDKRCFINWNNEPATNMPRLLREGLVAIDEAVRLGRTLVMLNFSYGNPEPADHEFLAPLYRRMAETGMIYGCHEGSDLAHPTLASCYPDRIGRFLDVQRLYGLRVIVTEFAASLDAHNGWQTWDSNYARVCDDTVREVYAPNGVVMTPFTAFKWKNGFDYVDSPALQASWKDTNRTYPVKDQPVTQHNWGTRIDGQAARMSTNINVRALPSTGGQIVGTISDGQIVSHWSNPLPGTPYRWYKILFGGVERYVAEVSGLRFETPTPPAGELSMTNAQYAELVKASAAIERVLNDIK